MHRHRLIQVAAVMAAAMLLAFQALVQQAVLQGQARQVEVSRHAAAWHECSRMPERAARESCRALVLPIDDPAAGRSRPP